LKTAYVTTLCNGDGYLPGVEVLGKSIEASGSKVPKIVLVTADISQAARARLAHLGWQMRDIEPIENPAADRLLFPRFATVFAKLRVWELVELDRVVLLDADTLVLQNVDDLFERRDFAAGPDFFLPDRFNSGVMVLEPSADTFRRMIEALSTAGTYDGGDQGFLNTFFANWYSMPVEHRLPVGYNMAHFIYQFLRGHPTLKATLERDTKIVHYMVQKPWQARATLTGGSEAWWHMYFQAHPEKAKAWREKVHAFEDWTFDHLASLVLD
jgi:alpha-N-acetylglucosamine transferase